MYRPSTSAAGVRFLAAIKEGRGLKRSAREAGIDKEVGYRWLRERYLRHRRGGLTPAEAQAQIGFESVRIAVWESEVGDSERHHLCVEVGVETAFWEAYDYGADLKSAAAEAGISRATAYRWLKQRFNELRASGATRRSAGRILHMSDRATARAEQRRGRMIAAEQHAAVAAHREALASSRQVANRSALVGKEPSAAQRRRARRNAEYWRLMRSGETNTNACKILGMCRHTGTNLRRAGEPPKAETTRPTPPGSGRYLDLRERLQIADLLRFGFSMRRIAHELGRHPSTIKRELDRHRDAAGRYLPRTADHDARRQRTRPRPTKLAANPRLRQLVQRKLNRCWSPDEICGWMKKTYPDDSSMRLCPETIYRELLLRDNASLHKRYCAKLRTGRRVRRTRWLTRSGHGPSVTNKTMIDKRPASVEDKLQAGHWEGDLIVGRVSGSAMVTLRERTTQYGIILNLPHDHTAASVNTAVLRAFANLPVHMKRTLTWDQGVEMAKHEELTAESGVPIYFAERCSPWQRGANENFNGLARQYFPKGTDLSVHSDAHVAYVTIELNQRPRKGLGYDTPALRFAAESASYVPHSGVTQ